MKLKLTEQQVKGLIQKLNEQEDFDMEKEAPNLSKLVKYISNNRAVSTPDLISPVADATNGMNATNTPDAASTVNTTAISQMIHPLGHKEPISSNFGARDINVPGASKNHQGVDISARSGSPVYAPLDGTVISSRDTTPNPCGGFIQLDHELVQTKFCHLRKMVVRQGDKVKKGQIIGYSGGGKNDPHPGVSTGPHLHYEILNKSGVALSPTSVQPSLG